ncbi:hypothetical protein FA15DRAFT_745130 [Coprinopsis marcescibilis]|uniref:DUF6533 domain-containing protein n=1 Tax=Coprinopsis marcescibilis TaxID=230819 RepID=A0A5C3KSE9_COPMA|nr:hypothetical protein FA15DRAFT_745130 [Coprinopsis marcescibilis]
MSSFATMIETLRRVAYHNKVFNYAMISSLVLYAADYLHTFPTEVRLVWPRKWSLVKWLYLLARNLPLVYGPFMAYSMSLLTAIVAMFKFVVILSIDLAIMFVRVYALCGRNKKVLYWLNLQFIAIHAAVYTLLTMFLLSFECAPSPIPDIIVCVPVRSDTRKLAMVFAIILSSESIIMLISLAGFWKYRKSSTQLFKTLRNDGIIYYVLLTREC